MIDWNNVINYSILLVSEQDQLCVECKVSVEQSRNGKTHYCFTAILSATSLTHWFSCFSIGLPHVWARNLSLSADGSWWSLIYQLKSWLTDLAVCLTWATSLSATSMSLFLAGNFNIFELSKSMLRKPLKLGTHPHVNYTHLNTSLEHSISGAEPWKLMLINRKLWSIIRIFPTQQSG